MKTCIKHYNYKTAAIFRRMYNDQTFHYNQSKIDI